MFIHPKEEERLNSLILHNFNIAIKKSFRNETLLGLIHKSSFSARVRSIFTQFN